MATTRHCQSRAAYFASSNIHDLISTRVAAAFPIYLNQVVGKAVHCLSEEQISLLDPLRQRVGFRGMFVDELH